MTSKQRSVLMSLASKLEPVAHIGKSSITPELTASVSEAIEKRELIKIDVNKNCFDDLRELGNTLAERTQSELVQVIGRKIVLYKPAKDPKDRKIEL
ncbi:MAG: ribosome assembly RNA-binding protein YhbY [Lachnospiraceae bacterium]|nr:ribosome assembly RNA-binding protein YhbY [Lachnospiraceae bacterium]